MSVVILRGDAASLPMADESVDAIVTDPPYGLEFMGREWDTFRPSNARIRERVDGRTNPAAGKSVTRTPEAYVAGAAFGDWCEAWAGECLRVLRPGGYLAAFGGTRTYHWLACGIERAGFEIRDSLHWLYGSGFPKGKACLKPAHEPIVLARKAGPRSAPLPGLDACRVLQQAASDDPRGASRPRGTFPHSDDAWGGGRPGEVSVTHDAGRWPPNVLLTHAAGCEPAGTREVRTNSHHPAARGESGYEGGLAGQSALAERKSGTEAVEAWDCAPGCPVAGLEAQTAGTRVAKPSKTGRSGQSGGSVYGGGEGLSRDWPVVSRDDAGGASRFFPVFRYEPKAPASERPRLADGTTWPTVKPVAVMRWLARLVTPPGGTVLDLFCGTGTTGEACELEGFKAVLLDRDPQAIALARVRLAKPVQPSLFGEAS